MHVTRQVEELARAHHSHRLLSCGACRLLEVELGGNRNHEDEILTAFALRDERLEDVVGILPRAQRDIDARVLPRRIDRMNDMVDMRGIEDAHGVRLRLLLPRHRRPPELGKGAG